MNTLYETIKTYGTGKGEEMMWKSVAIISESIEKHYSEEEKEVLLSEIYGLMSEGHYNKQYAEQCVQKMYYVDKAGEKHYAPYWPEEAVKDIYEQSKAKIPGNNFWDFFVTFQMLASNNWILLHTWWPDITPEQFAEKMTDLTVNWFLDADWESGAKTWRFLHKN